jgi:hypothetical protein
MYYVDVKTGEYIWRCPQCGEDLRFSSLLAVRMTEKAGGCQGCLARSTFKRRPEVVPIILDFWIRTGRWPQSSTWMEAVKSPNPDERIES